MKLLTVVVCVLGLGFYANADPQIIPIPGGLSGSGITTRYWDCCKVGCSWKENLAGTSVTTPVRSCTKDGVATQDVEDQSGCTDVGDNTAFTCNDQQPWVYNSTVSYGWVAASFTGGEDYHKCCSCVVLNFKGQLAGKSLIAQITNTGGPLAQNHFDIAMPGGGEGVYDQGCTRQWNSPVGGWGNVVGGVTSEAECSELPDVLQPGCKWRFEWFQGVDNPDVDFYEIECPQELLSISGCQ